MKGPLILAFAAAAVGANAVVLIGNYPQTNDTSTSAGLTTLRIKALGFIMPGTSYTLNSVKVRLQFTLAGTTAVDPVVSIHAAGTATAPGAVLHTLTDPGGYVTGAGDYVFTSTGFTLDAGTKYWLSVGASTTASGMDWRGSSPAITPTGLATHEGSLFTANGGTSWSTSATLNTYEINATVVPEPMTMAALGVGALALMRRRRPR